MNPPPILKKLKVEEAIATDEKEDVKLVSIAEQEEALVALTEHLKKRITDCKSQLEEAERRLQDSESRLACLRSQRSTIGSSKAASNGIEHVKVECKAASPIHESQHRTQAQCKPQLLIPAVNPKVAQPPKLAETSMKASINPGSRPKASLPAQHNNVGKLKRDVSRRPFPDKEALDLQDKATKRKFEQKEHRDLIPMIRSCSSPCTVRCQPGVHISSQHKRKLRSLALNPVNDQLFVTRSNASLLSYTDCVSPKQRRWPEDIAWHPDGDSLYSVYTADGGDSQISILNLNSSQEKRVTFLEEKPHLKGIINSIIFMPWADLCFTTGGSDHAVVLWNKKDGENSWKPKALHRNLHSSAVMGVAGMQQKQIVISAGADKRIVGYDLLSGRADYKHQIESKCMSVLPNPADFNLFMVQTGAPEKQLRLFDIRLRQTEIHAFGWKQESSESQSALINQAWSPDGLYITSGSADPKIHIFDIRYNGRNPSQSVKAHQKRVFKAVWHHSLPLLISISSDLHIGLHKII
ncbi:uncharacterized protein LOC131239176 isoform X2 [Magnolia sinica]|uniref:uncharacterized protein LOC131239176 isoform X2 n=1 Tax=Magnolia sinica TaxID=86752 RepID=UPI0026599461|nr:uncharacterized protein LOC131239176 isoform X2 [Magnolia sinica]